MTRGKTGHKSFNLAFYLGLQFRCGFRRVGIESRNARSYRLNIVWPPSRLTRVEISPRRKRTCLFGELHT